LGQPANDIHPPAVHPALILPDLQLHDDIPRDLEIEERVLRIKEEIKEFHQSQGAQEPAVYPRSVLLRQSALPVVQITVKPNKFKPLLPSFSACMLSIGLLKNGYVARKHIAPIGPLPSVKHLPQFDDKNCTFTPGCKHVKDLSTLKKAHLQAHLRMNRVYIHDEKARMKLIFLKSFQKTSTRMPNGWSSENDGLLVKGHDLL
ncbi:hypothetical protein HDU79_011788, partial [Rhizoclosmatium sp. JEL0117]